MFLWMVETCFFWVVWRRRVAPSGLSWKVGLFIFWERVDWSSVGWARSGGVELKSESVSGDWVVAINVGMIDCHAHHGAAA